MWLFDVNILIYAFRPASPFHKPCDQWLREVLHRGDAFFLAELVELAFLRLNTLPLPNRVVPTFAECWNFLTFLRKAPGCHRARIGERHGTIFQGLCHDLKLSGNDLNDAWLTALALEHKITLVSADEGFDRFTGLRWLNPLKTDQH